MSQALVLKVQDSAEVLWQAFKRSTCVVERRFIQLIALLTEGKSKAEVRSVTRYGDPAYCKAVQRYNAQGLAGLRDLRHTNLGAPQLLSDAQMLLLAQAIRFDFGQGVLWNSAKVGVQTAVEQKKTLGSQYTIQSSQVNSKVSRLSGSRRGRK